MLLINIKGEHLGLFDLVPYHVEIKQGHDAVVVVRFNLDEVVCIRCRTDCRDSTHHCDGDCRSNKIGNHDFININFNKSFILS